VPKAPRENHRNTTAGPTFLAGLSTWHLSAKAGSVNDRKCNQRHLRADFTGHIFLATSRCQKPTSDHLFGTLRRFELWDPAQPTRGMPLLSETHFEKACGAPFSWEPFQRSTPQTMPESNQIGGMVREAKTPHPI